MHQEYTGTWALIILAHRLLYKHTILYIFQLSVVTISACCYCTHTHARARTHYKHCHTPYAHYGHHRLQTAHTKTHTPKRTHQNTHTLHSKCIRFPLLHMSVWMVCPGRTGRAKRVLIALNLATSSPAKWRSTLRAAMPNEARPCRMGSEKPTCVCIQRVNMTACVRTDNSRALSQHDSAHTAHTLQLAI